MTYSTRAPLLAGLRASVLLAIGFALALSFVPAPALRAQAAAAPAAENLPSLPLSSIVSKSTGAEDAPYVLTLKNESAAPVKVSAKVVLSVAFHADSKARLVPDHVIGAGETWTISDLAKGDRVIVSADGFASLQLSVE